MELRLARVVGGHPEGGAGRLAEVGVCHEPSGQLIMWNQKSRGDGRLGWVECGKREWLNPDSGPRCWSANRPSANQGLGIADQRVSCTTQLVRQEDTTCPREDPSLLRLLRQGGYLVMGSRGHRWTRDDLEIATPFNTWMACGGGAW